MIHVERNFLELRDLKNLKVNLANKSNFLVKKIKPDFQLNKFFYKQVGKKYNWFDRLVWNDQNWINYISKTYVSTYVLKYNKDLVGFSELILDQKKNEIEIAYLGILEEYFGKKLGGFLLSELIKKSFSFNIKRVWVHTCSLDHKHALKNYLSRGMKVFKSEIVKKQIA